eukprot:Clim_evm23s204 gene=Clim_evmTU23s204
MRLVSAITALLIASSNFVAADYFATYEADCSDGVSKKLLLDSTHSLPRGGEDLTVPLGDVDLVDFSAGSSKKHCGDQQLAAVFTLNVKEGVREFTPRVKIQTFDTNKKQWETKKFGLLGADAVMDFSVPDLAGPGAPRTLKGGETYHLHMNFKDQRIHTPLGNKHICVNLNLHEVTVKVSRWTWMYLNVKTILGTDFWMNIVDEATGQVMTSIRLCIDPNDTRCAPGKPLSLTIDEDSVAAEEEDIGSIRTIGTGEHLM